MGKAELCAQRSGAYKLRGKPTQTAPWEPPRPKEVLKDTALHMLKHTAPQREAVSLYLEIRLSNPDSLKKVVDRLVLGCLKPPLSWVTTISLSSSKLNSFNSLNGGNPRNGFSLKQSPG